MVLEIISLLHLCVLPLIPFYLALESIFQNSFSRDLNDEKFFNLALQNNADGLISEDKDVLSVQPSEDPHVLTPSEALREIKIKDTF